ncbi:hypothetical protein Sta7437_4876 (plasmid) [Stanieria cyanosphaera PCC 7437]|uniref:Uncharacterized protein n=1 Tax=Stanieria cyanosphaera (strain ATCC 29371 / PCC 7437) TaxID=111780 RepID=K9Y1U7_STAC7|nr:hypothetical protein [Stanieria cyanosphaera]AFZ38304.1 hypothetical protein Sta7437_4876 [Stanieria cyanosphaera PCC 7437]
MPKNRPSNTSLGHPIIFGKTLRAVIGGKKTCIRKLWSERHARHFIKRYERGLPVAAFDKDKRRGGSLVGWLRLTEKPYQELLLDLPEGDLVAEGYPKLNQEKFIDRFFNGDPFQEVWVIKFEFEPLSEPNQQAESQAESSSLTTVTSPKAERAIVVEVIEELTDEEQQERLHLERQVERSFYVAGKALQQLRDRRLYRSTHSTFEDYCRERFGYSRRHPYLLIDAAIVVDNLSQKCDPLDHILPTSERQVRPLSKLDRYQQVEVWQQAVEEAGGVVPSSRIVRDLVQRIKEKTKVPNPYRVGEVCQIVAKDNLELRGKGGCWCIVSAVHDFSCTVNTWDCEYLVKLEHLKSLDYTLEECQQMEEIGVRMSLLRETGKLDEAAIWILNGLAKLKRAYLTSIEEKLLSLLETEYGVVDKEEK